jgi:penicillin amidase
MGRQGNDIFEYLISQNPSAENPEWGYVYSANNQPGTVDGYLYPDIICQKIEKKNYQVLDSNSKWDKESVSKMMVDNTSLISRFVTNILSKH